MYVIKKFMCCGTVLPVHMLCICQGFLDSLAYGSSSNMHKRFSEILRHRVNSFWSYFRTEPRPSAATSDRSSNLEISGRSTVKNVIQESSLFTLRDSANTEDESGGEFWR